MLPETQMFFICGSCSHRGGSSLQQANANLLR